jgi:hypothetical protein
MLMLVVTIIIAAVVSGFAGGMGSATKETPKAAIDVKISTTGAGMYSNEANVDIKLLSGDAIPTKDLAIITYYTNSTSYTYRHEQTVLSEGTDLYGPSNYSSWYGEGYDDCRSYARVPFLNDMRFGYAGSSTNGTSTMSENFYADFGNFTWKSGDIMCTNGNAGTADLLGINDDEEPHGFSDVADFSAGKVVDVKILHKPSGRYLFNKEVVVS